jgi:hypothetical protein
MNVSEDKPASSGPTSRSISLLISPSSSVEVNAQVDFGGLERVPGTTPVGGNSSSGLQTVHTGADNLSIDVNSITSNRKQGADKIHLDQFYRDKKVDHDSPRAYRRPRRRLLGRHVLPNGHTKRIYSPTSDGVGSKQPDHSEDLQTGVSRVFKTSRSTRQSADLDDEGDDWVSTSGDVRPGAVVVPGWSDDPLSESHSVEGEGEITTSDLEQEGPVRARAIDEDEYRNQIEVEYHKRIVRDVVVARSVTEEALGRWCGMSRWSWILGSLLFAIVASVSIVLSLNQQEGGQTVQAKQTCEETCEGLLAGNPVTVNGPDFQQAILDYLRDPSSSPYGSVINCWDVSQVSTRQLLDLPHECIALHLTTIFHTLYHSSNTGYRYVLCIFIL